MSSCVAFSRTEFLAAAAVFVSSTSSVASFAAQPPSRIFVAYQAPPACPDRATFVGRLLQRVPESTLTEDSRQGRIVSVTLEAVGDQILGRMEFVDETGRSVIRTVQANGCEEVVVGMAFVTAMALEAPAPFTSVAKATRPSASTTSTNERTDVTQPPVLPTDPAARASNAPPPKALPTATPSSPARPYVHEVGLRVGVLRGLVGPGVALGAGVEWGFGPKPLLPLFRFAATWTDDRKALTSSPRRDAARFQLVAGEAQLCLGAALVAPTLLTGAFCSGLELGRYWAQGIADTTSNARGSSYGMFWGSIVSSIHVRVESDRVFFDFSPSLRLPLVRREFVTLESNGESHEVHHIPVAAVGAACSMGMSFR